jgi:hypothetical protein
MRSRTADPYHAMVVLYQLSYNPLLPLNLLDRVPNCQYFEVMACGLLFAQPKSKHSH